jgi:acyl dehydratase
MIAPGDIIAEWDFPVEHGKLREFARAVRHPESEPFSVPPTFTMVPSARLVARLVTEVLGLDRARTVHGEQAYEYFAPIRPGDLLRCSARMLSDDVKEGRRGGRMRIVRVEFEYRSAAMGKLLCREVMTSIEKGEGSL